MSGDPSPDPHLTLAAALGLPVLAAAACIAGFVGTVVALHASWPGVGVVRFLDVGLAAVGVVATWALARRAPRRWWLLVPVGGLAAGAVVAALVLRGQASI